MNKSKIENYGINTVDITELGREIARIASNLLHTGNGTLSDKGRKTIEDIAGFYQNYSFGEIKEE